MTDINLGEGSAFGSNTALGAGIGGFIGSWFGNGFGYGGFGNRGIGAGVVAQNGFDTAMLHDDNMSISNQLDTIGARQIDANYQTNMNLSNGISSAYAELTNTLNNNNISNMQNQFATQSSICNLGTNVAQDLNAINQNISSQGYESRLATQNLGTQMGQCCCSLKTAIADEGAKTRELIQNNFIQGLETALADAKGKNTALENQIAFTNSQTAQTQYLLAQLGAAKAGA